ncbi:mobile element protein [Pseudanabaena sp. lw0831]|nr:mobile element protein [Pseudanabaena sp. lw0831]
MYITLKQRKFTVIYRSPNLGFLWCFERLFVKSGTGRQLFNVLGALNAVTHELITVTNDSYINALL